MNPTAFATGADLAELVSIHLQDEEAVLAAALPVARVLKAALTQVSAQTLPEMVERHRTTAELLNDIKVRRERFRELLGRRMQCDADSITVTRVLQMLPADTQSELGGCVARIRAMADEFVAINRWLTINLRMHLDAYQRLLCDLTGSARTSGRYGPAGQSEANDYRPLIQVRG